MTGIARAPAGPGEAGRPPALESCAVAVVSGGRSSEREVSLSSGREVLRSLGANADGRGPRSALEVEIGPDGLWRVGAERLDPAEALRSLAGIDVFFLGLHGGEGEDGTLQGLFASLGRRHTGSGVRASALCMDKLALRSLAALEGMRVAPGRCVSPEQWSSGRDGTLAALASLSLEGWVAKPRCGGSSVETHVVGTAAELAPAVEAVLATGDDALVEARIEGVEVSCGVLGNRGEPLRALAPIEIRPAEGRFFDYQQKYAPDGAREVCPPEGLAGSAVRRVRELALRAHRLAGCDGYSRADFIVPPGEGAEPVLLEVNTLPGLTARSLVPQEAAAEGMDHRDLCLEILALALRAETR